MNPGDFVSVFFTVAQSDSFRQKTWVAVQVCFLVFRFATCCIIRPSLNREVALKISKHTFVALVIALLAPLAANAIPITQVVGNVNILGQDYVVSVLGDDMGDSFNQTYNALAPTITFDNLPDATEAGQALLEAFGPLFDWQPWMDDRDGGRIVWKESPNTYHYLTLCCDGVDVNGPFNFGRDDANVFTFIQFSAVEESIPEPGTLALFGLGLFGIGISRRRKKI